MAVERESQRALALLGCLVRMIVPRTDTSTALGKLAFLEIYPRLVEWHVATGHLVLLSQCREAPGATRERA